MPVVSIPVLSPGVRPYPLGIGSYNTIGWGPGQKIQLIDHAGVEETPTLRTNDLDRAEGHGTWTGVDWIGGRTVTLTLAVIGDDSTDLRTLLAQIERAWVPGDSIDRALWMYDSTRYLTARVRRRRFDHVQGGRSRVSRAVVEFYARDPLWSSANAQQSVGPVVVTGGLVWPIAWPVAFGSVSAGGAVLVNAGTIVAPIMATVIGPVTNPALTNESLSATIRVNITLGVGDVLVLDTDARTVTMNGASRDYLLDPTSRWWGLLPGSNTIRYSSGSAGPSESATVAYSSKWP